MAISSARVMAQGSTSAANKELVAYISANYHWQKVLAPIVTSKDIKRRDRNANWVWNSSSRRESHQDGPQRYCITLCRVSFRFVFVFYFFILFYCHAPLCLANLSGTFECHSQNSMRYVRNTRIAAVIKRISTLFLSC